MAPIVSAVATQRMAAVAPRVVTPAATATARTPVSSPPPSEAPKTERVSVPPPRMRTPSREAATLVTPAVGAHLDLDADSLLRNVAPLLTPFGVTAPQTLGELRDLVERLMLLLGVMSSAWLALRDLHDAFASEQGAPVRPGAGGPTVLRTARDARRFLAYLLDPTVPTEEANDALRHLVASLLHQQVGATEHLREGLKGLLAVLSPEALEAMAPQPSGRLARWLARVTGTIEPLTPALLARGAELSPQQRLLTNDALMLAVMEKLGVTYLATNDDDFDSIPGLIVCKPARK